MILTFDEPIDVTSIKLPLITLFSNVTGNFISLSSPPTLNASLVNQTVVFVHLPSSDLNRIKVSIKSYDILDCMVMEAGMVADILGNKIRGNTPQDPIFLRPSLFLEDVVPPTLLSFVVDLMSYTLILKFDEVVDRSSFKPWNIILQSSDAYPTSSPHQIRLSNYTVIDQMPSQESSIVLNIDFYQKDARTLDSNAAVFTNLSNSFIAIHSFTDIFGNGYGNSVKVYAATAFIPNTAPLQLVSFDFLSSSLTGRAGEYLIKIYFSRAVSLSTFSCVDYRFSSESDASSSSSSTVVTLAAADCTLLSEIDSNEVVFTASESIFASSSIGSTQDTTWISTSTSTTTLSTADIYGNKLAAVAASSATRAGPRVIRFSVDMNSGIVMFVLSSSLTAPDAAVLNTSSIGFFTTTAVAVPDSLQTFYTAKRAYLLPYSDSTLSLFNPAAQTVSLETNSSVLMLQLDNANLNVLKRLEVTPSGLYLLMKTDAALVDLFGQTLNAIAFPFAEDALPSLFDESAHLRVDLFVADVLEPVLETVTLDLGQQLLTLQFNEPINASSVDVTGIRLQQQRIISYSQNKYGQYNYLRLSGTQERSGQVNLTC